MLFAKCINKCKRFSERLPETPHDIIEKYSCYSDQKDGMLNGLTLCANGKLCQFTPMITLTRIHVWVRMGNSR